MVLVLDCLVAALLSSACYDCCDCVMCGVKYCGTHCEWYCGVHVLVDQDVVDDPVVFSFPFLLVRLFHDPFFLLLRKVHCIWLDVVAAAVVVAVAAAVVDGVRWKLLKHVQCRLETNCWK